MLHGSGFGRCMSLGKFATLQWVQTDHWNLWVPEELTTLVGICIDRWSRVGSKSWSIILSM